MGRRPTQLLVSAFLRLGSHFTANDSLSRSVGPLEASASIQIDSRLRSVSVHAVRTAVEGILEVALCSINLAGRG